MTRLFTGKLQVPDLDVNTRPILVYDLSESPSAIEDFQLILLMAIPPRTCVIFSVSLFVSKSSSDGLSVRKWICFYVFQMIFGIFHVVIM